MKTNIAVACIAGSSLLLIGISKSASNKPKGGEGNAVTFLLSKEGCGRATAYAEANRIVTAKGKTHVAWLDSPAEGFRVRIRTLDHKTGKWSKTYTVGEAYDNHGGPALTRDSKGYLHIVYYPHHHPMRYRKSKRPDDASEWNEEVQFGERLTYPTLVCGKDDTLYLTARRSHSKKPWQVELWKQAPGKKWTRQSAILESRYPGYAHFQESLAWGPDHHTLHLCCRFHEKTDKKGYGRLQAVAYMVSKDLGKTWTTCTGRKVKLPATAEIADNRDKGGADSGRILRVGGMAVEKDGRPWLLYSIESGIRAKSFLCSPLKSGAWNLTTLRQFLPKEWSDFSVLTPGGISFDGNGNLIIVATAQHRRSGESSWGHPSSEVVRFKRKADGINFDCTPVSPKKPMVPHWLPNIERNTGHHAIKGSPAIIYTAGERGKKNRELLSNEVFFVNGP